MEPDLFFQLDSIKFQKRYLQALDHRQGVTINLKNGEQTRWAFHGVSISDSEDLLSHSAVSWSPTRVQQPHWVEGEYYSLGQLKWLKLIGQMLERRECQERSQKSAEYAPCFHDTGKICRCAEEATINRKLVDSHWCKGPRTERNTRNYEVLKGTGCLAHSDTEPSPSSLYIQLRLWNNQDLRKTYIFVF